MSEDANMVSLKEHFEALLAERDKALELRTTQLRDEIAHVQELTKHVQVLERWQSKMIGIGIVGVLLSGGVGAVMARIFLE